MGHEADSGAKSGLGDILRESSRLMAQRGYYGTSMRDLAQGTGRSLSGLYYYFSNKDELLYLINYHGFSHLLKTLEHIVAGQHDAHTCLYGLIYSHVRFFTSHRDEMKVMMWGTQPLSAEQNRAIRQIKDSYNALVQKTVSRVVETTGVPDQGAREISRKTYLLFGMMNWVFAWYVPQRHGSIEDLVTEIWGMFVNGVKTTAEPPDPEKVKAVFAGQKGTGMWEGLTTQAHSHTGNQARE